MKRMVSKTEFAEKRTGRHSARAKTGRAVSFGSAARKIVSILMCLCILATALCNLDGEVASAAQATDYVENRKADPNTMETYKDQLLSQTYGSRYAGRIWTDKSVFAYDAADKTKNAIKLKMEDDGHDGEVGFNADFAHVFSALASSQVVNEWPPAPIDLVIVFDMSASMGQDTRYGLDTGTNVFTTHNQSGDSQQWPAEGVLMSDRIEHSRIHLTLEAINNTIDKLMAQNPENRVAVCCYGANAGVLLPLAHYTRQTGANGEKLPYLKVGGMETLYHPGDLVWRDGTEESEKKAGWYWINNRDTAYTVEAHAMKNDDVSPYSMKDLSNPAKYDPYNKIISNNVKNTGVKAFPGVEDPAQINNASTTIKNNSKNINQSSGDYVAGDDRLIKAVADTKELKADDYIGYFTNTQGGIYLAYKQLADSNATTYTDRLSDGKDNTVARVPAAIIMSDGGANFAFNRMGETVDDWNLRYGAHLPHGQFESNRDHWYIEDNTWGPKLDKDDNYVEDQEHGEGDNVPGREEDVQHRLNENRGDEWWDVYLPGDDTLKQGTPERTTNDGKWDGLHTLYNVGADYYHDGTLTSPAGWSHPGVFYSNDVDWMGTPATILEVLLTASYMKQVATKHYETGWEAGKASPDSQSTLSTYTMNVDTKNLPQWARWRLFPTLDPKNYPPDGLLNKVNAEPGRFANQYGSKNYGEGNLEQNNLDGSYYGSTIRELVFGAIEREWNSLKTDSVSNNAMGTHDYAYAHMYMNAPSGYAYNGIAVSANEILDHIAYNDEFNDVTSGELDTSFDRILSKITGNVFTPISGSNDAGVGDSITYQDPLGEYMEIKNQSITTKTHNNGNDATYDMSLLLFGKMHGLVRAGVYDWNWNNQYMLTHSGYMVGQDAFPMGWYRGDDPANAETPGDTDIDDSGTSYPTKSKDGGETYSSAADARAKGWVFRLDYKTLLQFVPITGVDDTSPDFHPSTLPAQVKNTVYTCYRFAGSQADRNELRRNPIFGDIPDEVQKEWNDYISEHGGSYPDNNSIYADTPGVYRISDIRVWIEDTGDFIDTDGAIAPNAGYDRSLYLNVPAAAVPTQLATVTLGPDGVLSYETNLGADHPEGGTMNDTPLTQDDYYAQSTPLRLFYAVGLEDDLLLKDENGKQIGVDFTKISAEYIANHTVEGQDYVWFISNFYSNTTYNEYVTDTESYRTRGDPTVSFSPSVDNRYYVFQKPLPLYAHAYRYKDGALTPVDANNNQIWTPQQNQEGGNGSTVWENDTDGGSWTGGEFMGTYHDETSFRDKLAAAQTSGKIKDDSGAIYEFHNDGIVFFESDVLDHVTSNTTTQPDGTKKEQYDPGSVSFSSNDYFFILVEYYLPDYNKKGQDVNGNEVENSHGGRTVQYVVARRGSEFGSAFASDKIDNGDMLCWTDMSGHITKELAYLSKTDTGDKTRGEPTFEKLTYKGQELKNYLKNCGITDTDTLNAQYDYWTGIQADEGVQKALDDAKGNELSLTEDLFQAYFKFAVAARPGGIRTGDMSNNIHTKGDEFDSTTGYYTGNVTKTANNYYVPTVSDNSATDDGVILNTYLGNNGYLEIANQMLHVTKMLEPPAGFELTEDQLNEKFNYQIYVQGVTGKRTAALTQYNEYAKTWERQLAYIDVLTDNSDLVLDNDSHRAVFITEQTGGTVTAKMVVAYEGEYYVANEDGTLTFGADGANVDTSVNEKVDTESKPLYYMYLPPNSTATDLVTHSRRLYQNTSYNGSADGYDGAYDSFFSKNGTTTFFETGQREPTGTEGGTESRDSYRDNTGLTDRPAGTRTYWALDAELIPKDKVDTYENPPVEPGEPGSIAVNVWTHNDTNHGSESHIALTYFTFVIRRPNDETSETNFTSPFKTRSLYLTKEIEFGVNANEKDDGTDGGAGPLTAGDLYDQIIPSADRPDLFSKDLTNAAIAANTAEFTLKHGEGLLLSGLDNRITYRFTEKLTDKQMKNGYTLKQISHIQQRGSESIYLPGVQEIPIYTRNDSTYGAKYGSAENERIENGLTWKWDSDRTEQVGVTKTEEPFAHTNAIMWEYYATMAADASGNHHQPSGVTPEKEEKMQIWSGEPNQYNEWNEFHQVADNPSCTTAPTKDELTEGACDLKRDDDTILHYMYYKGELIDPHYEGEASTYLRNMARYGVSPTVRFGVNDETQGGTTTVPATAPKDGYYDYNGVYSVYGNTGWFEEQANYTNTVAPELLVLTKEIHDRDDNRVDTPIDKEFEFTLTLASVDGDTLPADRTLYMWKGTRTHNAEGGVTLTSSLTWEDAYKVTHNMPTIAPALDAYQNYLLDNGYGMLQPVELDDDGKYTVKLKANEAAVFYGMLNGKSFTFTETQDEEYPAQVNKYTTEIKKITSSKMNPAEMQPATLIANRADFVNLLQTGSLTVEKRIKGDDPDTDKEFGFTITLTPREGDKLDPSEFKITKYNKEGTADSSFKIQWTQEGNSQKAEVKLKHGEKLLIDDIPIYTTYTVEESQRNGYNLQHVADNSADEANAEGTYLPLEDNKVSGTISTEKWQVYLLFVNEKALILPFVGGIGVSGIMLVGLAFILTALKKRKRRRNA